MFIGRKRELNELITKLNNDKFESILIYGRRRIGKTVLIQEAAKTFNGKYIYYECKQNLLGDNLIGLNKAMNDVLGVNYNFITIKDCLEHLFKLAINENVLLVIDEFPFIYERYKGIVSNIRDLIDNYKMTSKIKFIISGSYVDVMKSLNDGSSETYGRFTSIIPLLTFNYYESSLFYPNYSDEDKILMYSIFGGVAFYDSLIDTNKTAIQNIKDLIIAKNSILQLEVENTILSGTNKIPEVNSILEMITLGVTKYSDIRNRLTSLNNNSIVPDYLLKKLVELEIIERVSPINDKLNNKRAYYKFSDNLMEFYYSFINRYKSINTTLSTDNFYKTIVEDKLFNSYLPHKFEDIAREFLILANNNDKIKPIFYEIGTYSFNDSKNKINRQFDVVTKDQIGYISYECKYSNNPINNAVVHEEEYQILKSGLDIYKLGFISKAGFDDDIDKDKYNLFSLEDFYSGDLKI